MTDVARRHHRLVPHSTFPRLPLAALVLLPLTTAYPEYVNCGSELKTGQRWMGKDSVASTLSIALVDVATGMIIACGASVAAGTWIRAKIANLPSNEQYLLEAIGATQTFGNICSETTRSNDVELEFEAGGTVSVVGAHAPTYGTVYVTSECVIRGAGPMSTPIPSLTRRPTGAPTTALPTLGACASDRDGFDFAYAFDGSLALHWTLESDRVKAALVTDGGWAAWGWGSDGMMVGADCVIQSRRWPTRRHRRGHPAQV